MCVCVCVCVSPCCSFKNETPPQVTTERANFRFFFFFPETFTAACVEHMVDNGDVNFRLKRS